MEAHFDMRLTFYLYVGSLNVNLYDELIKFGSKLEYKMFFKLIQPAAIDKSNSVNQIDIKNRSRKR